MSADPIRNSTRPVSYDPYARQSPYGQGTPSAAPPPPSGAIVQSSFEGGAVATQQPANPHAELDALKTQLTTQEKKEFLAQYGVKDKHLKKAKQSDIDNAFNQLIDHLKSPGKSSFKAKIGGKKYEFKINVDTVKGEVDIQIKEKKGFWGKVWDGVKKVGKIALAVASFIPGPIGVAARVANAVISAVGAIKKGDWLGGIAGFAGAVAGGAGALAGKAVSGVAKTVSTVANVVQKGALAAKTASDAIRAKDWGGLLNAVATGASGISGALGNGAGGVANAMNRVAEWATRGNQALQLAAAARNGDIIGVLTTGADLATGIAPNSRAAQTIQRLASGADTAQRAYDAAKRGDVLGAVAAGAEYASGQVGKDTQAQRTLQDIAGYAGTASQVHQALRSGDYFAAAQRVASFAAGEVNDPKAKRNLERAAQVFEGAGIVQQKAESGDYLGAAQAAAELAGKLTGADEAEKAGKLLAAAGQVRTALQSGDPGKVLAAIKNLGKVVKDVTDDTQQKQLPTGQAQGNVAAPVTPPTPPVTGNVDASGLPEGVRLGAGGVPVNAYNNPVAVAGYGYVVQTGDTLAKIANRAYGDASRWAEIYAVNRSKVGDDANLIAAGLQLALPADSFRLPAVQRAEIFQAAAKRKSAIR